jgi:hypothetical protein
MLEDLHYYGKPRRFNKIVDLYLAAVSELSSFETCYELIKCNRGPPPSCLDWREVCDGKIDCLDGGGDELRCEQIYLNECADDEYRCRNGLCILNSFFQDNPLNPDCMDRSDEHESRFLPCEGDWSFRCEETTCRNERKLTFSYVVIATVMTFTT